jgi:DNA-directed RNA polymerase specialized sigma24 family protein
VKLKTNFADDYASSFIHAKALQLSQRPEFQDCEISDLKQELTLQLLTKLDQYDSAKETINTYICRVINNVIARMINKQKRKKKIITNRTYMLAMISDTDFHISDLEVIEKKFDVDVMLSQLPKDLRRICQQIMAGVSSFNIQDSRRQWRNYQEALDLLLTYFRRHGFDN